MQIAGRRCGRCEEKIVTASEGLACEGCELAFHRECMATTAPTYRTGTREPRRNKKRCPSCGKRLRGEAPPPADVLGTTEAEMCGRCRLPHAEDELCFVRAGLSDRVVGQIIDGSIAFSPVFLLYAFDAPPATFVVGLVLLFGYHLFADGLPGGQSLGKRLLGIAVVDDRTAKPCSYGQSALRNAAQILGWLDWIWILGEERKRAGDHFAKTRVVRRR
jgi:hypothetical protein